MKKIAGIVVLGLGLVLLGLNFTQPKMVLPTFSTTKLALGKTLPVKNEAVKIILPSIFNFMSKLLR